MAKNYLIDFTFRNICFMNFIESSSISWKNVIRIYSDKTELQQQKEFMEANNNNLIKYNNDEKISSIYTHESNEIKILRIREWARKDGINLSKDCEVEDLNLFIDKHFYPKIQDKLISLKKNKDPILRLLFHHLVNNFFSSINLLIELKKELYMNLKAEQGKLSTLIIETNNNEKELNKKINQSRSTLNKTLAELKNEKIKYEEKILSMEETMKKLKIESLSKKKFTEKDYYDLLQKYQELLDFNNSLFMENEILSSDVKALKNENAALKLKLEDFHNKFQQEKLNFDNKLKEIENKFNMKLNKLNNEFIKEKEQRINAGKALIQFIESNNKNVLNYIKNTLNIQEQQ